MAMLLLNLKKTLLYSPVVCRASTHVLLLRYSSSTSPIQNPDDPKPHFMKDYLITSCGFPPDSASHTPDAVIRSLKHYGFNDTHLRCLISRHPTLLSSNSIQKSIDPNMRILLDMGFSGPELPHVVIRNTRFLTIPNLGPRIQFWKTLLDNDDKKLRLAFERNRSLIDLDASKCVTPKIALFKKYGLSDLQIQRILLLGSQIFTSSTTTIEALLNWTLGLGITSDSSMFVYALHALARTGRAGFEAKMELLKKCGWAEHEFLLALQKAPNFVAISEKNIRITMEFLVGRAGCMPSYIALHPLLLAFSVEKRLMPRHHVLQILKEKDVCNLDFYYMVCLSEKMFLEKFIPRYKEEVLGLHEMYLAACAGKR